MYKYVNVEMFPMFPLWFKSIQFNLHITNVRIQNKSVENRFEMIISLGLLAHFIHLPLLVKIPTER